MLSRPSVSTIRPGQEIQLWITGDKSVAETPQRLGLGRPTRLRSTNNLLQAVGVLLVSIRSPEIVLLIEFCAMIKTVDHV